MNTTSERVRELADWMVANGYEGSQEVDAVAYLRAYADSLERAPNEPSAWQPIETAPPDRDVLLYCPTLAPTNLERIELGFAVNTRGGSSHAWATHWMPLPSPPQTKEGGL